MSPNHLSRRRLVATAAALSALAAPAAALASVPAAVDPIYVAIAAHRTANLEFHDENSVDEDHPQYENEMERLSAADNAAAVNLCDVQPTTIAGAIALLNYYAEVTVSHDGEELGVKGVGEVGIVGVRKCGLSRDWKAHPRSTDYAR